MFPDMLPLLRPALLPVIPAFALLCGCVDGTPTGSARVTFIVTADLVPAGSAIHLAGSSPDLGPWNPDAVHLERGADGAWTAALDLPREERFEYKFTRGTWWTEGVGADGVEMPNFALDVPGDTTVRHHIPAWRDLSGGPVVISHDRLANKGGTIELYDRWRYRAGDSLAWASPAYDDGAWPMVPSLVSPSDPFPPERAGRGWFRLHLKVDSALAHAPLAWSIAQTGASEVYLNGRLIARLGTLGTGAHDEVPFEERTPRVIVMDGGTDQLLAIRYSDFAAARLRALEQPTGLTMYLGPADVTILSHTDRTRIYSAVQVGLVTLALVLAALHLFLYLFNRSERGNLYFSLLIAAMALLSYADLESFFATAREQGVFLSRLSSIGALALSTASLGAVYTFDRGRRPVQFPFFAATAAGLTAWLFFGAGQTWNLAFTGFMGVSALEILRVVAVGFVRDLKSGGRTLSGSWMIGSGGIIFVLGILYQIAANLNLAPLPFTGLPPFYLGFIMFAVSISLQFAYRAGRVNRELAAQLDQVRALSARTLEQERRAREEEVSRRILEADNTRKTRELEEARRVQLAMLPADVPHVAGITIAVRMRTATEVGGDYYDFRQDDDGSVTIAIGDATGHGTKAGIMVTLIKSLFNVSGHSFYIPDFFQHCTSAIRRMNIEQLYMALQIARIKGRRLTVSSAGMPPLYVYRAASGSVEEVVLKGMPLGAFAGFPYQQISLDLHPGDTMLLLSDGFPERFNMGAEILGYGRVKEIFAECGSREPEAVIDHLVEVSERWSGGAPLNDDMTFIVIQGV